jgi:hypothetical protein
MPAINANIVVEQTTLTLSPTTTQIGVTVDPINLGIYTTSPTPVGGSIGQLQYNVNGAQFGGVANTSVANGNVTFTNLSNVKIDGGTNAYYLQTDGTGNLTWAAGGTPTGSGVPSGANTQIQLSDGSGSFASGAGFTFDNASNVFTVPGDSIATGNVTGGNLTTAGNIDTSAGIFNGDGGGLSNIAAANVIGGLGSKIENGTSNVDIATADGNITMGVNGNPGILTITDIGLIGDGYGLSNIAAGNVTGLSLSQIANGTSNVDIATSSGNIDLAVGSAPVARFSTTGAAYPAVLTVQGNINAYNDITAEPGANFVGTGSFSNVVINNGNINLGTNAGLANRVGINNIAIGNNAGANGQGTNQSGPEGAIAIGNNAGYETQNRLAIAIGNDAGKTQQSVGAIAIGTYAGETTQGTVTVAIGIGAGRTNQAQRSIGIGYAAGDNGQQQFSVALGDTTGWTNQGANCISIGTEAGYINQSNYAIAIGHNSGNQSQGIGAVAIGAAAGRNTQGVSSVAIGQNAGYLNQGDDSVAIGNSAGQNDQGFRGVHIGAGAGYTTQGTPSDYAVNIGYEAGRSVPGVAAINIGAFAGRNSNQAGFSNNSIIINATGSVQNSSGANRFHVKPVRNAGASGLPAGFQQVAYNPTTGEFVYYS